MKTKEIRIYTAVFLLLSLFGASLTFATFSNLRLSRIINNSFNKSTIITDEIVSCSTKEEIENLNASQDPNLRSLNKYQNICNSFVSNRLMIFIDMPVSIANAEQMAKTVSTKLLEFSKYKIEPVVIVEPVSNGVLLNYDDIAEGEYDDYFDAFFVNLKKLGIEDKQMGIWVPFPESNVPYWDHGESLPQDYATNVNKYLFSLKQSFPQAKGSILLNAVTYDPEDTEWENGDYVSLLAYTRDLNPDLVDSIGIQGLPWVSRASSRKRELFNARDFISMRFAVESAKLLRTKDIWVNTGSFGAKYTDTEIDLVTVGADQRKTILEGILFELAEVQEDGYRVWVNIFAQDKSITREATDWSYTKKEGDRIIFREFIAGLSENDIELSLFDSEI